MENPKKAIVLAIAFLLFSCRTKEPVSNPLPNADSVRNALLDSIKARVTGHLYWDGKKVEGLDNGKLSMIRIAKESKDGIVEFITDGKRIYIGDYPLNSTRLSFAEGLSAKDRRRLERLSKSQPPPLE